MTRGARLAFSSIVLGDKPLKTNGFRFWLLDSLLRRYIAGQHRVDRRRVRLLAIDIKVQEYKHNGDAYESRVVRANLVVPYKIRPKEADHESDAG